MNRKRWQRAYGDAPRDFHRRLADTLAGLEEHKSQPPAQPPKGRVRRGLVLLAAVLTLLAGGALAANHLEIFHILTYSSAPILPLEGAEDMAVTGLGAVENHLVRVSVEEAVFDGQMVLLRLQFVPQDSEHYALFDDFLQDTIEEDYILERVRTNSGVVKLRVLGRKDGKQILGYNVTVEPVGQRWAQDGGISIIVQEREDGSIDYWIQGYASIPPEAQALDLEIVPWVSLNGTWIQLDPMVIQVPRAGEIKHAKLTPISQPLERFSIIAAGIDYTPVAGILTVAYDYQPLPTGEELGISLRLYDENGNEVNTGSGGIRRMDGIEYWQLEVQSLDPLPDSLWIEAQVIGGPPLGRIQCQVTPVDEPVLTAPEPQSYGFG